jgi:gluconolactonase
VRLAPDAISIMGMPRLLVPTFLLLAAAGMVRGEASAVPPGDVLEQKIQSELSTPPLEDRQPNPNLPQGEVLHGFIKDSPIYPGTSNGFDVYVPAQYDPAKPACLLLKLDGLDGYVATVLDNLIGKGAVPIMIGVGISAGATTAPNGHTRFNRSYEFDSVDDRFSNFVLTELLPAVGKLKTRNGRPINLSTDGNDHAVIGASSGGAGAFTLAWRRPDQFTRVYSLIGTFVSMRGGNEYPALIRKTDPQPIRIFLEDGSSEAAFPLFGSWYEDNLSMESALSFSGYDVGHAWGTHGHDGGPGMGIFPDVLRWLWRDYPAPIKPGASQNSMLQEITLPGESWQKIPQTFRSATGLAADPKGEIYLSDAPAAAIYHFSADDRSTVFLSHTPAIIGQAFGCEGNLYGVVPDQQKIIVIDPSGSTRTVADGIAGRGILVTHDGTLYVSAPGDHGDLPSQTWRIQADGNKKIVDRGLVCSSGVAFSPDGAFFFAAESSTRSIYSYVVQPDGTFAEKEPYYWLHSTDILNASGAEDLAVDMNDNLYAATSMGVQVCDENGRVRAILPLPKPCGPTRSLCFGGEHFDILYVTDGHQVFKRKMKVAGYPPWTAPVAPVTHNSMW